MSMIQHSHSPRRCSVNTVEAASHRRRRRRGILPPRGWIADRVQICNETGHYLS